MKRARGFTRAYFDIIWHKNSNTRGDFPLCWNNNNNNNKQFVHPARNMVCTKAFCEYYSYWTISNRSELCTHAVNGNLIPFFEDKNLIKYFRKWTSNCRMHCIIMHIWITFYYSIVHYYAMDAHSKQNNFGFCVAQAQLLTALLLHVACQRMWFALQREICGGNCNEINTKKKQNESHADEHVAYFK